MNTFQDIREFYETTYPSINPDLHVGDIQWKFNAVRPCLDLLEAYDVRNVLELGCGSGKLLERVSRYLDAHGFGMDISHTILKKAKSLSDGIDLVQGTGNELPFNIARFDVVYFADLLEHLEDPHRFLIQFREADSFVMLVPLESGWISNLVYRFRRFTGKPTTRETYGHLHRWRKKDILDLIEKCGLNLVTHRVMRGQITQFQSVRGKTYGALSELFYSLSPRLHEKLFGGWTFTALCSKYIW